MSERSSSKVTTMHLSVENWRLLQIVLRLPLATLLNPTSFFRTILFSTCCLLKIGVGTEATMVPGYDLQNNLASLGQQSKHRKTTLLSNDSMTSRSSTATGPQQLQELEQFCKIGFVTMHFSEGCPFIHSVGLNGESLHLQWHWQ